MGSRHSYCSCCYPDNTNRDDERDFNSHGAPDIDLSSEPFSEEEEEEEDYSVEDLTYYQYYIVKRSKENDNGINNNLQRRIQYENTIEKTDNLHVKKRIIDEYEAFKEDYYLNEFDNEAKEALKRARSAQKMSEKSVCYITAIRCTNNLARKAALKMEYNTVLRNELLIK